MERIRLGLIGADSFHCVALVDQYLKMVHVDIVFLDTTIRGDMNMTHKRQPRFMKMLEGKVPLKSIDLNDHEPVDMYLILNVDSKTHLSTLQTLQQYKKPIFVDKPMFTDLKSFDQIEGTIMSSSALRFADFLKEMTLDGDIHIEAPLFFVDEVQDYFWYGIHMVEMLETLTDAPIDIESIEFIENGECVTGLSNGHRFKLVGLYEEVNFKVTVGSQVYELESYDHLYKNLALAILDVTSWPNIERCKRVIQTVLTINHKKSKL